LVPVFVLIELVFAFSKLVFTCRKLELASSDLVFTFHELELAFYELVFTIHEPELALSEHVLAFREHELVKSETILTFSINFHPYGDDRGIYSSSGVADSAVVFFRRRSFPDKREETESQRKSIAFMLDYLQTGLGACS
jgi:hypothetical protein